MVIKHFLCIGDYAVITIHHLRSNLDSNDDITMATGFEIYGGVELQDRIQRKRLGERNHTSKG